MRINSLRILAGVLICSGAALARAADPLTAPVTASVTAPVAAPADTPAAAMRASFVALQPQLARNNFDRPLVLVSKEGAGTVSGDIHAVVNARFESAEAALASPDEWCAIMFLHINTKACRTANAGGGKVLDLWIGSKESRSLAEDSRLALAFRTTSRTPGYLRVALRAPDGPMGTRDYHILLEAIPLENAQTFIHLAYNYAYGTFGQLAMQAYLATIGRDKVGFTLRVPSSDGGALAGHIGGPRGIVERNTMRYYLAIEAYLGALSVPPQARFEKRIRDWYAAVERYPRQLHDAGEAEYLAMKRDGLRRPLPPPS